MQTDPTPRNHYDKYYSVAQHRSEAKLPEYYFDSREHYNKSALDRVSSQLSDYEEFQQKHAELEALAVKLLKSSVS